MHDVDKHNNSNHLLHPTMSMQVLNDAEVKQFTIPSVKNWWALLKEAVYKSEDILDEMATEAQQCKIEAAEAQPSTNQVGNIMPSWAHAPFDNQSTESRVEEIFDILDCLGWKK